MSYILPLLLLLLLLKITVARVEIIQGDQLVTLGQTRFLSCVTSANEIDEIEEVVWKKDGIKIEENNRISISEEELLIDEIKETDAGSYECHVTFKNASTSSSKPVKLTLYEDIRFDGCIATTAIEKGTDGQITCAVESVPKATLTWIRNNITISKKDLEFEVKDEVLMMKGMQEDAVYSIVAKQRIPGIIKKHHVSVTVFERVVIDGSGGEVNVTEGEKALLICKATAHPHPVFNFFNGSGKNLEGVEGYNIMRENSQATLKISKTSAHDMSDITCSASNQFSVANTTFFLNVLQTPRILTFKNITSTISQILQIECQAYANPLAYIEIGKVQEGTNSTLKQRSESPTTSFTFTLEPNSLSNQGSYYCLCTHAGNTHFPDDTSTNFVEILYKPMIEEEMNRKVVKTWLGQGVELVCVVKANPEAIITWSTVDDDFNQVEFSFTEHSTPLKKRNKMFTGYITHEPHDYYHSHIIVLPTNKDKINRSLKCKATNQLGSVEEMYEIEEAFVPGRPTIHGIFDIKATSIGIKVSVEDDGGAKVKEYTTICYEKGKRNDTQVIKNINIYNPGDMLYVDGLRQKTGYIVQVAAVNGVGTGEFSTSNATTKERDVPSKVNVTMESLACHRIDYVNVKWTQPYSSGLPVKMYRVGYRIVTSDTLEKDKWNFNNTIQKSIKLTKLNESSQYEVYVLAQNDVGWGKEGTISKFNTCRVRLRMRGSCPLVESNLYFVACVCLLLASMM